MKRIPAPRALTFLGSTLLVLSVFGACSNDDDSSTTVTGPPSISIANHTFGAGIGPAGGPAVACGNPLSVTLNVDNWLLKEAGLCESSPQCGQVRVTVLREPEGTVLSSKVSVSAAVDLSFASPLQAGSYTIEAELIEDAGNVITVSDAGSSSAQKSFELNPAVDCPIGATSGGAGAGGASSSEAGAGGFGGAPPDLGAAGSDGLVAGAGGS